MNACLLLAGAKQLLIAGSTFTLTWSHPVEPARWSEDWNVGLSGFQLVETRVAGGLEPPQGAVLDGEVWRYHPALAFFEDRLVLARSGATGGAWDVCEKDQCRPIPQAGAAEAGPAILVPCP